MRHLLDFDDAGAGDDEPVKGVTVGDIRAWSDSFEYMRNTLKEIRAYSTDKTAFSAADEALEYVLDKTSNPNEDPSGQRREPMKPDPRDNEKPF